MTTNSILAAGKRIACTMTIAAAAAMPVFATSSSSAAGHASNFSEVVAPVVSLIEQLLGPLLMLVGAIGAIYCVILGVNYAKAVEPQDREKAKTHLKNAIIGFVLIFVLIVVLKLAMDPLVNWVNANAGTTIKVS